MSRFPADRYNEQRLIQEVMYLHSLWHQGPPNRPHHPTALSPTPVSLQPSSSTQFKKSKKKSRKAQVADSGIEWPIPTPAKSPVSSDSGWPSMPKQPTPQPHLPTSDELARFTANRAQQQALRAVSEYLKYSKNAEDDDNDDEDEDAMDVEEGCQDYEFFVKLFDEDGALREYYVKNSESGGEFSCLVCCGLGKKGWKKRFKDCVALVQHSIAIANTNNRKAHRAYAQVICKILGWDINRLPSIVLSAADKPNIPSDEPPKTQGNEDDVGKSGLSILSNTTDAANIRSDEVSQLNEFLSNENQREKGGSSTKVEGNEGDVGKNGLSGLSNTTEAVNVRSDEVSQLKESFSNENQQENGGSSTAVEGNEDDDVKKGLGVLSNTTDTANIGSDEVSQQKESFSNENQQETGGSSAAVEHDSPNEANANSSLEDISNNIPEMAKENAGGASNCLEPLQEDKIVAKGDNDVSKETTIISDQS